MMKPSSEFKVQRSEVRAQNPKIRTASGFTYIGLLVILVIIGISLGAAGKYWQNVMLREKEEELLFRGDQYRRAIEQFYFAVPGRPQYPESIEVLLTDNRTAAGKHHLRKKYKDPISGEDFVEIRDQATRRIIGVHSPSTKTPLRQDNFPDEYPDFAGKDKYSDWNFLSTIKTGTAPGLAPPPLLQKKPSQFMTN